MSLFEWYKIAPLAVRCRPGRGECGRVHVGCGGPGDDSERRHIQPVWLLAFEGEFLFLVGMISLGMFPVSA